MKKLFGGTGMKRNLWKVSALILSGMMLFTNVDMVALAQGISEGVIAEEITSEEETEVSEIVSEEDSEMISEEISEEVSEEVSEEISEEESEEVSEEESEETSEEDSEEVSEEESEETSEETTEEEEASEGIGEEETELAPSKYSNGEITLSNPVINEDGTIWDCIYFGNYWQTDTDKDGDFTDEEKEPIRWRVLKIDGNNALLMTDRILDGGSQVDAPWESMDVRKWLNGDETVKFHSNRSIKGTFYNNAFSVDEKNTILYTDASGEESKVSDSGDKVFILSATEIKKEEYGFTGGMSIRPFMTEFSSRYVSTCESYGYYDSTRWLLRTTETVEYLSGKEYLEFCGVGGFRDIELFSFDDDGYNGFGICPAIIIDLTKNTWKYAGKQSTEQLNNSSYADFSLISAPIENTNNCAITGYYGHAWGAYLDIPEKLNGYTVTEIKASAFSSFRGNVYGDLFFPNTIEKIEHGAFYGQNYMTIYSFPSNLQYIGGDAFYKVKYGQSKLEIPSQCTGIYSLPNLDIVTEIRITSNIEDIFILTGLDLEKFIMIVIYIYQSP